MAIAVAHQRQPEGRVAMVYAARKPCSVANSCSCCRCSTMPAATPTARPCARRYKPCSTPAGSANPRGNWDVRAQRGPRRRSRRPRRRQRRRTVRGGQQTDVSHRQVPARTVAATHPARGRRSGVVVKDRSSLDPGPTPEDPSRFAGEVARCRNGFLVDATVLVHLAFLGYCWRVAFLAWRWRRTLAARRGGGMGIRHGARRIRLPSHAPRELGRRGKAG